MTQEGDSTLMIATRKGMTEVTLLMVKTGTALDLRNKNGDSALMTALREGISDIAQMLLEAGANTDIQNMDGDTALMIAASSSMIKAVLQIVKAGAALDLQNKKGYSATMLASNPAIVKVLVRAGADLNLQNEEGLSALAISSSSGRTDLTKILLSKRNTAVNIQTINGWSPLFFAAIRGDVATAKLLLKAGANSHHQDHKGVIAMDYAAGGDHYEVCDLLSRHMKKTLPPLAKAIRTKKQSGIADKPPAVPTSDLPFHGPPDSPHQEQVATPTFDLSIEKSSNDHIEEGLSPPNVLWPPGTPLCGTPTSDLSIEKLPDDHVEKVLPPPEVPWQRRVYQAVRDVVKNALSCQCMFHVRRSRRHS
jgi:ankyrin repeat protein